MENHSLRQYRCIALPELLAVVTPTFRLEGSGHLEDLLPVDKCLLFLPKVGPER